MKKRIVALALCLMMLFSVTPVLAAEFTIQPDGAYLNESGEKLATSYQPYTEDGVLYLPVRPVLEQLGVTVNDQGSVLKAMDVTLTMGDQLMIQGDKQLVALRPPVERDGIMYVPSPVLQKLFGLVISQSKDGSIKIRLGEAAQVEADDSWYYELVGEEEPDTRTDLEIIRDNINRALSSPNGDPTSILKKMRPDGSFDDIDYNNQDHTNWDVANHLTRIQSLCKMIYCPENPYYRDPEGMDAIARGIKYWFDKDFKSVNWWWNNVGVPSRLKIIDFFKPEGISDAHQARIYRLCWGGTGEENGDNMRPFYLHDDPAKVTSKFRTYMGSGTEVARRVAATLMMLSTSTTLTEEEKQAWLDDCMTALNLEYSLVQAPNWYVGDDVGNGDYLNTMADYTHHTHGDQLMQNNYGANSLYEFLTVIKYLEGTSLRLSDEAAEVLAARIMDGYRYTTFKNYMVSYTFGRGIGTYSAANNLTHSGTNREMYIYYLEMLIQDYPNLSRKAEMQEMIEIYVTEDKGFTGNKYFWISDFLSHSREDYMFAVFTPSTRMKYAESALGLNKKNIWMGSGMYDLLKHGDEYGQNRAEYDWEKLPGTTVEQGYTSLLGELRPREGTTDFVGGVSDGMYGFSLYPYDVLGVKAKKAYFTFDDEIVCLGTDINAPKAKGNIVTTLNQTKVYGEIKAGTGSTGKVLDAPLKDISGSKWVLHDGIGYVVTGNETLMETHELRKGDWFELDEYAPEGSYGESEVFILYIDHGEKPAGATYEYTMLPNTDEAGVAAYAQKPTVEVVSNTGDVQAVWHKELKILQAAFYKAGSVTCSDGLTVTVDKPCAVMVRIMEDGSYQITASDPNHGVLSLKVSVSGMVNGSADFAFEVGSKAMYAGKSQTYDSKAGGISEDYPYDNDEYQDFETPAILQAIAIDGSLLSGFNGFDHTYSMTVSEIPEVKAKGNFPTTVEHQETRTLITVQDPEIPENKSVYVINWTFKK